MLEITELTYEDVHIQGVLVLTEIFNGWEKFNPIVIDQLERRFIRTFGE